MDGLILSAGCIGKGRRLIEGRFETRPRAWGVFWMQFFFFSYGGEAEVWEMEVGLG